MATPRAPPMEASSKLSVSSCRTTRNGEAPRAVRSAISRRRAVPRASKRFATLEQAISSTKATQPISISSAGRTLLVKCVVQRLQIDAKTYIAGCVFAVQTSRNGVKFRLCLLQAHPIGQANKGSQPVKV